MQEKKLNLKKINIAPYVMILPIMILLAIFAFYPLILSIVKSTYRWSGTFSDKTGINQFIGLQNFIELFQDEIFFQSWLNSLFFVISGAVINLVFPFICALLIFSLNNEKASYRWRVAFVAPMVVPSMVIFLLWQFIYDVDMGVINNLLSIFGMKKVDLLGRSESVKWAIRFMGFPWVGGVSFLIYYAGLQAIPESVYEAASLDGITPFRRVVSIDLAYLVGQIKYFLIIGIINGVQVYDIQLILGFSAIDPASTVPGYLLYHYTFGSPPRYGYAASIGVVLFLITLIFTVISNKVADKKRMEDGV